MRGFYEQVVRETRELLEPPEGIDSARRAAVVDVLEVSIEKATARALKQAGFRCRKDGRQGWPDQQVFIGNGLHFWLELKKRRGGRLTPAQRRVIPQLAAQGDIVLVRPTPSEAVAVAYALRAGRQATVNAAPSLWQQERKP